jgi:voltage-gated potassium channel
MDRLCGAVPGLVKPEDGREMKSESFKSKLKRIVEQNQSGTGLVFMLSIQFLILLSLISFSLDTMPDLSATTVRLLGIIETVTITIFTAEYALRFYVADSKRQFAGSFYGIVDLVAILPFYLGLIVTGFGVDFRSIRVLRLLRLFAVLKFVRYSKAIRIFARAFVIAKEELILFLVAMLMLLYLAAVGVWYFENESQPEAFGSIFSSLWWAIVTLTTVGYGDVYPLTIGGRVFTFFLLMIGLGTIAIPSGIVASALGQSRSLENEIGSGRDASSRPESNDS